MLNINPQTNMTTPTAGISDNLKDEADFIVSRSHFRAYLSSMYGKLDKLINTEPHSDNIKVWQESGLNKKSKWKDIIKFVRPNVNYTYPYSNS